MVIQQRVGVRMWLGGVKREVSNRLDIISLCQGIDATLKTIDNLIKDSSKTVYDCKQDVTTYLARQAMRRCLFLDDGWVDDDNNTTPMLYSIVFDNVNNNKKNMQDSYIRNKEQNAEHNADICRSWWDRFPTPSIRATCTISCTWHPHCITSLLLTA